MTMTYYLPEDFRLEDLVVLLAGRVLQNKGALAPCESDVEFYPRSSRVIASLTTDEDDVLIGHQQTPEEGMQDLTETVEELRRLIVAGQSEFVPIRRFILGGIKTIENERALWNDHTQYASRSLAALLAGLRSLGVASHECYALVAPLLALVLNRAGEHDDLAADAAGLFGQYAESLPRPEQLPFREQNASRVRHALARYAEERNQLLRAHAELRQMQLEVVTSALYGTTYHHERPRSRHDHHHADGTFAVVKSANPMMTRAVRTTLGQAVDVVVQVHPRERRILVVARRAFGGLDEVTYRLRGRERVLTHIGGMLSLRDATSNRRIDSNGIDMVFTHPSSNVVGNMDRTCPQAVHTTEDLLEIVQEVLTGTY